MGFSYDSTCNRIGMRNNLSRANDYSNNKGWVNIHKRIDQELWEYLFRQFRFKKGLLK